MRLAELDDARIVTGQRTGQLDRRRDQKAIRRITVFEMMQPIAARPVTERHRLDAGRSRNRSIQASTARSRPIRPLSTRSAISPAAMALMKMVSPFYQQPSITARVAAQAGVSPVAPQHDIGVEQKGLPHRSAS